MRIPVLPYKFLNFLALAGCLQANTVLASIYPTQPTSKTIFSSGQLAKITWRDDWHAPRIADMADMRIDLHGKDSVFITTLAKDVAPALRSHSVFIPTGLSTGSYYMLRFVTPKTRYYPSMEFYSADFTITSQSYLFPAIPITTPTTSPESNSGTGPNSTAPAAAFIPSISTSSTPVPTIHPNPLGAHPGAPFRSSGAASASPKKGAGTKIDLDGSRFHIIALFWPALVGITMAL